MFPIKAHDKSNWKKITKLLPTLLDVLGIFEKAEINDQHSLIREVFKHPLTYKDGMCRTPTINPAFAHNLLKINEKRLLYIEQPPSDLSANPMCTQSGKLIEHILWLPDGCRAHFREICREKFE